MKTREAEKAYFSRLREYHTKDYWALPMGWAINVDHLSDERAVSKKFEIEANYACMCDQESAKASGYLQGKKINPPRKWVVTPQLPYTTVTECLSSLKQLLIYGQGNCKNAVQTSESNIGRKRNQFHS